jgi:hypothetical protein
MFVIPAVLRRESVLFLFFRLFFRKKVHEEFRILRGQIEFQTGSAYQLGQTGAGIIDTLIRYPLDRPSQLFTFR